MTLLEKIINNFKNNKLLAILIFLGMLIIAIGSFTDAIKKIFDNVSFFMRKPTKKEIKEDHSNALNKGATIVESTIDFRIRELLGKEKSAVIEYLGEPDDTSIFQPDEFGHNSEKIYLSYKRHGITFLLSGSRVKTIFFYRQGVSGHIGYKRDIVQGLSPGMSRMEIEHKFGRPTTTGTDGVIDYYVSYGNLIPDCSVTINYDTKAVNDTDAIANIILIQSLGK